ncbi:MAG TPA: hypothetical protein ENJ95_13290 [Bacteroidetes bacterium]|nr:hypothetical protein [Bacteroidota bacterium]
MKFFLFLFFPVFSFFSQTEWQEYKDPDGRFKVLVPGQMTEKVDSVETEIGLLAYHNFIFQEEGEGTDSLIYMAGYVDYPEGIIFADSVGLAAEFFQNTMEAAAGSMDGEIMYDADIQLDGHAGKLWRINFMDGQAVIKTKAFLVKNSYCFIQTISFKPWGASSSSERFLGSLKLL